MEVRPASSSDFFTPGEKTSDTDWIRSWVDPRAGLDGPFFASEIHAVRPLPLHHPALFEPEEEGSEMCKVSVSFRGRCKEQPALRSQSAHLSRPAVSKLVGKYWLVPSPCQHRDIDSSATTPPYCIHPPFIPTYSHCLTARKRWRYR
jgi:hypothetical protein